MAIADAMRRAGWRRKPSPEIYEAWKERGGEWQACDPMGRSASERRPFHVLSLVTWGTPALVYRSVHPDRGWDYDPRGWGGDLTPTEPGWYWLNRDDRWWPVDVKDLGHLGFRWADSCDAVDDVDDAWGGPCQGMPGEVEGER